jgi:hypothetical protein
MKGVDMRKMTIFSIPSTAIRKKIVGDAEKFTAAMKSNFDDADYYRGLVYDEKRDCAGAWADWAKALEVEPNHAGALKALELLRESGYWRLSGGKEDGKER